MADRHRARPGVTTATGPVRFDPLDPAFVASPYEQYAVLRHADPVHWSDLLCGWVLTRYDDVEAVLRDPSMSSDIRNATPTPIVELELEGLAQHGRASRTIVHLDDPDHARVRKLMAEPFRVREINRLGGLVDEHVAAALDRLGDLAYPLPVEIFSAWLGMPDESTPQFRRWTGWVARSRDPMPPDERAEFYAALDSMHDYLGRAGRGEEARPDGRPPVVPRAHRGRRRAAHPRRADVPARHPLHGGPRAHGQRRRQRHPRPPPAPVAARPPAG
jgi:cytochrome P450